MLSVGMGSLSGLPAGGFATHAVILGAYVLLSLLAFILCLRHVRRSPSRPLRGLLPLTILLVAAMGMAASAVRRELVDRRMRGDLMSESERIARAMDPDLVTALTFSGADATHPAHIRLCGHLRDFGRARGHRSVYTLAASGGRLVFGPESLEPGDPYASPPGTVFESPQPGDWAAVTGGVPAVIGPVTDEYGTFVSALAPVQESTRAAPRMAVGIDVESREWMARLAAASLMPMAWALSIMALLLAGQLLLQDPRSRRRTGVHRHAAAAVTASLGLLLTVILVWTAQDVENRSRDVAFSQLAGAHARRMADVFADVGRHGIASLATFFESSDHVTHAEFQTFAHSLSMPGSVVAYEWVPRVPAAGRARFEAASPSSDPPGCPIWEPGPDGRRVAAAPRPVHHPVLFAASPTPAPAAAIGFDRSSDPAFLAAAETALRSGLTTAAMMDGPTDGDITILRSIRIQADVKGRPPAPDSPGFMVTTLRPGEMVRTTPGGGNPEFNAIAIELATVPVHAPREMGVQGSDLRFSPARTARSAPAADIHPLFVFGRTMAISIRPGHAFLAATPPWAGIGIALAGCLVTFLLAAFVGILSGREHLLGEEVHRRTRELRESERRLMRAQQAARMGSWQMDPDRDEPEWSPEVRRLFGLPPGEPATPQAFLSRIHPDDRDRVAAAWREAADGGSYEIEYRAVTDDTTRWMSERIERDPESPAPCVGIVQDITDRKQLQDQLFQAQRLETVGRLAGGVAHDFNNLLQVISGFCDLLRARIAPEDESAGDLAEIERATERATDLTRQLLAFSRRQVMAPRVLDLNTVLENNRRVLARVLGEDIQFNLDLAPRLDRIRIDPGQFDQVFMNLAVNARDAMPGGGRLTITTTNIRVGEAEARTFPDSVPGRYVRMTVCDTGCGMSADVRRQVFEPFFTTKGRQGTGLGLSVVYGIVRQHEGFIGVESEPGRGATFHVCFPACSTAHDADGAPVAAEDPGAHRGHGETLLVVEDEPGVLRFMTRILGEAGYVVHTASTHAEALDKARRLGEAMNVLVSDVVLPDGTGLDLADQLLARSARLHVLLVSGHTEERSRLELIMQRGIHFLQKPLAARSLLRTLRDMLAPPAS